MEIDMENYDDWSRHRTGTHRQMFHCEYCGQELDTNPYVEKKKKWTTWKEFWGLDSGNPLVNDEGFLEKVVCYECVDKWWRDWEKQKGKEQEMNVSSEDPASSSMEEKKKDESSMECD